MSQFAAWQCSDFVLDHSKTQQVSRKPPATKLLLLPFLTAFQLPVTGGIADGIQKVSMILQVHLNDILQNEA